MIHSVIGKRYFFMVLVSNLYSNYLSRSQMWHQLFFVWSRTGFCWQQKNQRLVDVSQWNATVESPPFYCFVVKSSMGTALAGFFYWWFTWGMVKNRPLMGGALIEEYESMKTSAESKEPDISWHFAIVSFGSISIEGCVLRAALLHVILCAENWLSGSRSIPDWIPWNLHEARAGSRQHFRFKSVKCIVFSEIKGFLDACSLSQSLQSSDCKYSCWAYLFQSTCLTDYCILRSLSP